MIWTSSHNNCQTNKYKQYAISGNRGKDGNYKGLCYPQLAPKLAFWKIWHENIDKISEEENNRYYIDQYYHQVLLSLEPIRVYEDLNNSILLCYEDNNEFCHRHIVSAWLEIMLNIEVPEVIVNDLTMLQVERPTYIKQFLLEIMQKEQPPKIFIKKDTSN